MVRYNCRYCGYAVERNSKPKSCPYCSKENAMIEEEDADEILSDAM